MLTRVVCVCYSNQPIYFKVSHDTIERFGIQPDSHVVMCVVRLCLMSRHITRIACRYDSQGIFSSPRALFMFRSFGHTKSSILDGGLPRWEAEGHPVTRNTPPGPTAQTTYPTPTLQPVIESSSTVISAP